MRWIYERAVVTMEILNPSGAKLLFEYLIHNSVLTLATVVGSHDPFNKWKQFQYFFQKWQVRKFGEYLFKEGDENERGKVCVCV